jgi:O-succinylbenzoate synthase
MIVERVRVYEVALPLKEPFTISGGSLAVRRSLIVELEDPAGVCGYGECAPFELPFYSSETISSVRACLAEILVPRVVGQAIDRSETLWELLDDGVRGNRMARAGIETAWWDLVSRTRGVPLSQLVSQRLKQLGVPHEYARPADFIECGVAIGVPKDCSLSALESDVRQAVRRGYRRVKLKVRPGWDCEPIRAAQRVMESEGASLPLWVDANGSYDRSRHAADLAAIDHLGLAFIEQPFAEDALWDSAVHNREARTPVCLDESLTSDTMARQVVEMGGPLIWNLKIQRVGGLEEACRIYARGLAAGAKLWVGTMPETGVGAQAALALAGHAACVYPSDVEPSERWYELGTDLIELTMSESGTMTVPTGLSNAPERSRLSLAFEVG